MRRFSPFATMATTSTKTSPADGRLIYVADPMCSWCWGFSGELRRLQNSALRARNLNLEWVLGGLAPDSDEPMPEELRAYIQEAWRRVEETTGAQFNHDFWTECSPRRSTYPACRAVIAAEELSPGSTAAMFEAIQRAYYLEARNPSDQDVLIRCAEHLDLEPTSFAEALGSPTTQRTLEEHLARREALAADGLPSLYFSEGRTQPTLVMRGYARAEDVMRRIAP